MVNSIIGDIVQLKHCVDCKKDKLISEFDEARSNVLKNFCKACRRIRKRKQYSENPDKIKQKIYAWRKNNTEAFKQIVRRNHRKKVSLNYYKNLRKFQPGKQLASEAVKLAIQSGRLKRPITCSSCFKVDQNIQGHHDSYLFEDRLNVRWLCVSCHRKFHVKYKTLILLVKCDMFLVDDVDHCFISKVTEMYLENKIPDALTKSEIVVLKNVWDFLDKLGSNIKKISFGRVLKNEYAFSIVQEKVMDTT
jgi:hypothetical protein